jgi:hypothetical protein
VAPTLILDELDIDTPTTTLFVVALLDIAVAIG